MCSRGVFRKLNARLSLRGCRNFAALAALPTGICGVHTQAKTAQQNQRLTRPRTQSSAGQGEVRDSSGKPVGTVKVTLQASASASTAPFIVVTNADGIFRFK